MKKIKIINYLSLLFLVILISNCSDNITGIKETTLNNQMSFNYNEIKDTISIIANKNGYAEDEIVLRGSGKMLDNTIMLTFKLISSGKAKINTDMTGYWDLGMCIPSNKFLLTNEEDNYIQIDYYNEDTKVLQGEFNLKFRYENDPAKIILFSHGKFKVKVDVKNSFRYCFEG